MESESAALPLPEFAADRILLYSPAEFVCAEAVSEVLSCVFSADWDPESESVRDSTRDAEAFVCSRTLSIC